MKPEARTFKTPGSKTCIFCGSSKKMTHEHIFSKWLGKVYPSKNPYTYRQGRRLEFDRGTLKGESQYESRGTGDPITRRHKVVCESCNRGWMKHLQDVAKPIFMPLFADSLTTLNAQQGRILAAWATMAVMVMEYCDTDAAVIPQSERDHFRVRREPPNNWIIWIGRYGGGKWGSSFLRRSAFVLKPSKTPLGVDIKKVLGDSQVTTIIAGTAVFQAFSGGPATNIEVAGRYRPPATLEQIWPVVGLEISLPLKIG